MKTLLFLLFINIILSTLPGYGQGSLQAKAKLFIEALHDSDDYPMGGHDTLIDLNRDGYKDILVEYYGMSGTGLKNMVDIYPYDIEKKRFSLSNKICLANPTFYFKTRTIASYYIAYGGGGAMLHHWKGSGIVQDEKIDVEVTNADHPLFKYTLINCRTGKTHKWTDSMINLPARYRYYEYVPIIKGKGQ